MQPYTIQPFVTFVTTCSTSGAPYLAHPLLMLGHRASDWNNIRRCDSLCCYHRVARYWLQARRFRNQYSTHL